MNKQCPIVDHVEASNSLLIKFKVVIIGLESRKHVGILTFRKRATKQIKKFPREKLIFLGECKVSIYFKCNLLQAGKKKVIRIHPGSLSRLSPLQRAQW